MTFRNKLAISNEQLAIGGRKKGPKKILILGLGSYPQGTGISSAIYFAKQGHDVLATDLKTAEQIGENVRTLKVYKNVQFHLGGERLEDVDWADVIVQNPGVHRNNPLFKRAIHLNKPLINDITIFLDKAPCLTIGITGTRGKSTTTAWIADMLKRSGKKVYVGGNITVSPLTFLDEAKKTDIAVIELSSWLLETCGLNGVSPKIAVWTNVMNDHLNTYDGLEDYAEAKAQIMRNQKPGDLFIPNLDDKFVSSYVAEASGKVLGFSSGQSMKGHSRRGTPLWVPSTKKPRLGACIAKGKIIALVKGKATEILPVSDIGLVGEHNIMNALGSIVAALSAGANLKGIKESLMKFGGVPFRQEKIAIKNGVTFINDTTATTPDAAIAALNAFAHPIELPARLACARAWRARRATSYELRNGFVHWICGGADKGLDFSPLVKVVKGKNIKTHVLIGTALDKLTAAFKKQKLAFDTHDTLADAFHACVTDARAGDIVLLSPACASFGLFKNEFDRGGQFNALVEQWKKRA